MIPNAIRAWKKVRPVKTVTPKTIFQYMDGAGELYLGYRFKHLDVHEYEAPDQPSILLEIYWMETSDDAFGLLSLDWGGESVRFDTETEEDSVLRNVPQARFLYGSGLLRMWSDDLYMRIQAFPETPESRQAVLDLGSALVAGRKRPPPPDFLKAIPAAPMPGWKLRTDRISFLRSHLVLNSLVFLSYDNVLCMDRSSEGVFASYESVPSTDPPNRFDLVLIRYADPPAAKRGVEGFQTLWHFPANAETGTLQWIDTEEGWNGCVQIGTKAVFVIGSPDPLTGKALIDDLKRNPIVQVQGENP